MRHEHFICDYCDQDFVDPEKYISHQRSHLSQPAMSGGQHFKREKFISYDDHLKQTSKRFPYYKRYLGRGKDYYNIDTNISALRRSRQSKPITPSDGQ